MADYIYDKEYIKLVEKAFESGATPVEVNAMLGVPRETFDGWCNPLSSIYQAGFAEAVKVGMVRSEAYWICLAHDDIKRRFNQTAWQSIMRKTFRWDDELVTTENNSNIIVNHKIEFVEAPNMNMIDITPDEVKRLN